MRNYEPNDYSLINNPNRKTDYQGWKLLYKPRSNHSFREWEAWYTCITIKIAELSFGIIQLTEVTSAFSKNISSSSICRIITHHYAAHDFLRH